MCCSELFVKAVALPLGWPPTSSTVCACKFLGPWVMLHASLPPRLERQAAVSSGKCSRVAFVAEYWLLSAGFCLLLALHPTTAFT